MKCPVCEEKLDSAVQKCPNCGFYGLNKEFLNIEDATLWLRETVEPFRQEWLKNNELAYLSKSNRYIEIKRLYEDVKRNPAALQTKMDLLSLLYGVLFNPSFDCSDTGVRRLASFCLSIAEDIVFDRSSVMGRVRNLRVSWTKATLNLVLGRLREAYDLYLYIAKEANDFYTQTESFIADAIYLFFMSEVNIHQLQSLLSLPDEDFFVREKEEIAFFKKNNVRLSLNLTEDGYCFSSYTPRYDDTDNPFYITVNSEHEPASYLAMNMRVLHIKISNDVVESTIIPLGHGKFGGYNSPFKWHIKTPINIDHARNHVQGRPYKKINGYLHNVMGFSNASN